MKSVAYLGDQAAIAIIISAIESFPSKFMQPRSRKPNNVTAEGEIIGLLFGHRMTKNKARVFNVSMAIPLQIMRAKNADSVEASSAHWDRVREILRLFPMIEFLGDFHSHPWPMNQFKVGAADASTEDKESLKALAIDSDNDLISLIVGITHRKTSAKSVTPKSDFISISGCYDKYKYKLKAYSADPVPESCIEPVRNIICPFLMGMYGCDLNWR